MLANTVRTGGIALVSIFASTAQAVRAQAPDYDLKLMADNMTDVFEGQPKTLVATLTAIDPYVSINDAGVIAFTGTDNTGSKAFVVQNGQVSGITFSPPSATRKFQGAAINNATPADVASRDRVSSGTTTYLERKWPADGSKAWTIVGRSPQNFSVGLLFVDINDSGVVAFSGLDTTGATQTMLFAGSQAYTVAPPTELARYNGNINVRPQISNTDLCVIRDDQNRILAWPYPSGTPIVAADSTMGFATTGRQPGISHDGKAMAFSGDRGSGEGIFVSVASSTGQQLVLAAGEGTDGFTDFIEDDRVGVISTGDVSTAQAISVVVNGTLNGVAGAYVVDLTATETAGVVTAVVQPPRSVARAGDVVAGISPGAPAKTISSVTLYDPFNRHGTVALWASFTDGTHGIVRGQGDRDRDGLLDSWETMGKGIDANQDGTIDLDLYALGARPDHKDLFVEIDAMLGRAPAAATIDLVVNAFAAAPNSLVNNPDGIDGVTLHYQLDETSLPLAQWPNTSVPPNYDKWPEFDAFKLAHFGKVAERAHANSANILEAKRMAFRYVVFADQYASNSSSGLAEIGGNDCIVTLGHPCWPTPGGSNFEQAGTFMHELGHTLGLRHGGDDDIGYKPNYHSIMNYTWQLPGGPLNANWSLVYSAEPFADLNESALDESVGVGGPPLHRFHPTLVGQTIPPCVCPAAPCSGVTNPFPCPTIVVEHGALDWNGNGVSNDVGVPRDVTRVTPCEPAALVPLPISTHLDWAVLLYSFRDSPDYGDGSHVSSPSLSAEFTADEFVAQRMACPEESTYCVATVNSLGCTPAIGATGDPSMTGPDDWTVTATNVRSNRWGMLSWSLRPDQTPFGNGTRCLDNSTLRGPSQMSGGNATNDCSGTYSFPFSHAYMQANGLVPGDTVYFQIVSRDLSSATPMGLGFTEGLVFSICP